MGEGESHPPSELLLGLTLIFAPLAFGATESWSKAIVALGLLASFASRWAALGKRAMLPKSAPPLFWASCALLCLAAAQALNPASPASLALAGPLFTGSAARTMEWTFDWSLYAAVLLFAPSMFRTAASAERLAWLVLALGAVVACVGIAQQQSGNTHYYGLRLVSDFRVPFGPFPNKNHAGTLLAMASLVGGGLVGQTLERIPRLRLDGRTDEVVGRLIVITTLELLVLAGLMKSDSRGAAVALAVALVLGIGAHAWLGRPRWKKSLSVLLALSTAGLALIALRSGAGFFDRLLPSSLNSVSFRVAMIFDGLEMISEYPLFGTGLGALRAVYPLWTDASLKGYYTDHLHCDPIQLAAEGGVPLAVAFYLAYGATFARILRPPADAGRTGTAIPLGLASATAASLFHQCVEFPSQIMSLQLLSLICLCAALGTKSPAIHPADSGFGPPRKAPLLLLGGGAATAMLLLYPRLAAGAMDFLASRYPQPSKSYYETAAYRLEPSFERAHRFSLSNWQLAADNPAARTILLRTALQYNSAALALEPLHPEARRVRAGLLRGLGRSSDAGAL